MPKIDMLALAEKKSVTETREFTDPLHPGEVVAVTLRRGEYPDYAYAQDIRQVLIDTFVAPKDGKGVIPWPPPGLGEPIRWSERLCEVLALLEALQRPEKSSDAYDARDLALMSRRMPTAFKELVEWALTFVEDEATALKNGSAVREATSSAPHAPKGARIRSSTSTSVTHSGT